MCHLQRARRHKSAKHTSVPPRRDSRSVNRRRVAGERRPECFVCFCENCSKHRSKPRLVAAHVTGRVPNLERAVGLLSEATAHRRSGDNPRRRAELMQLPRFAQTNNTPQGDCSNWPGRARLCSFCSRCVWLGGFYRLAYSIGKMLYRVCYHPSKW